MEVLPIMVWNVYELCKMLRCSSYRGSLMRLKIFLTSLIFWRGLHTSRMAKNISKQDHRLDRIMF